MSRYSLGATATGGVLLVAALGLGVHEANRPVVPTVATTVRGDVGEEVAVGGTVVEVGRARSAPLIEVPESYGDEVLEYESAGRFLVVRVAYSGKREPDLVRTLAWRGANGAEYAPSDVFDAGYTEAQPGEWWHLDVIFEMPADAAESGTLRVLPEGSDWALPMEIGEVRVDEVEQVEEIAAVLLTAGRG
ncbi:hypothetical protein [Litorihabitans aurantiacus]|uniref:DUF4352 domain-containing protein n=1 Tax=Litorihabitans aurantiacus TaxID=1930061 RepID=A0AA37UTU1_9MICO|nr:hypothetical protein [Litorihabitans aurantiacus]GMA30051.1 hypothetical protein GCM10025875_00430 [Litorihabitans aurantiacus]GMA33549.1 hypothetical protein GCM10025875_35410 [Litorihabitans aurantiacus]